MNRFCKCLSLILTVFFIVSVLATCVYAESGGSGDSVETTLQKIAGILLWIGAAVCIGKAIHIGIMYMISSAEQKSTAKSAILPWVIGAILLAGFSTIGNAVINIFGGENGNGGLITKDVLTY